METRIQERTDEQKSALMKKQRYILVVSIVSDNSRESLSNRSAELNQTPLIKRSHSLCHAFQNSLFVCIFVLQGSRWCFSASIMSFFPPPPFAGVERKKACRAVSQGAAVSLPTCNSDHAPFPATANSW
jgi:hypothetical protein